MNSLLRGIYCSGDGTASSLDNRRPHDVGKAPYISSKRLDVDVRRGSIVGRGAYSSDVARYTCVTQERGYGLRTFLQLVEDGGHQSRGVDEVDEYPDAQNT